MWKFRSFQASQIFREINIIEFLSGKEKIREIKCNGGSRNIFREIGGKYFSFSINFTKKLRQKIREIEHHQKHNLTENSTFFPSNQRFY